MTTPEEDGLEASSSSTERSEEEPRLKFAPLCDETSPRAQSACGTRLCVSNDGKVLALGHQNGVVVLLDCLGNQVRSGDHAVAAALPTSAPSALGLVFPAHRAPHCALLPQPPRSKSSKSTGGRLRTSASMPAASSSPAPQPTARSRCTGCTARRWRAFGHRPPSRCEAAAGAAGRLAAPSVRGALQHAPAVCTLAWPQTLCLDPRYGSRKTRELVYGTAGGALILSSKVRRAMLSAWQHSQAVATARARALR